MSRKKIVIGNLEFKNQEEAKSYVREYLLCLEERTYVYPYHEEWLLLFNLIKRHPDFDEKIGPGISRFIIGRSKYNHIELNIEHTDGNLMDIIWVKCVSGK